MKSIILSFAALLASVLLLPSVHTAGTLSIYRDNDSDCKNATYVAPIPFAKDTKRGCGKVARNGGTTAYEEYSRTSDELLIRTECRDSSCGSCPTEIKLRNNECSTVRLWTQDGIKEVYGKYEPEATLSVTPTPTVSDVILYIPSESINPPRPTGTAVPTPTASGAAATKSAGTKNSGNAGVWVACAAAVVVAVADLVIL
eukprot:comp12423_c0_seq1/m.7332 comp12423_c0_seq1/g.7332  ORF comp12423_c0_seq1/g.7332 comp12423_c0_seq1/m.7332 type:complete len:200 (-) comp12423_c0_seq1:545-1144(-)